MFYRKPTSINGLKPRGITVVLIAGLLMFGLVASAGAQDTVTGTHSTGIYTAGSDLVVTVHIEYTGTLTALGVFATLPDGWTHISSAGSDLPNIPPNTTTGEIGFAWITPPASPVDFTYTINVPDGESGPKQIPSYVEYRRTGGAVTENLLPNPLPVNGIDTSPPQITILGDNPFTIEVGDAYNDPGATAEDDYDGDVTGNIQVTSNVDANTIGSYTVRYNLSDTAGNPATEAVRTVNVVDTTNPVITLNGSASVNHEASTPYNDAGATAVDNADGDITANIDVVNNVDPNTIGTYTVTYNVSDSSGNAADEKTRTVNVGDTTPPVITLNPPAAIFIEVLSTFTDPGATASDTFDGDVSGDIVIGGDVVDPDTLGTYTITYDVEDAAGNEAVRVTRTVTVQDTTKPEITLNTLNGEVNITLEVGSSFNDPGATANDAFDGDISDGIVVAGDTVDPDTLGTYVITYNVSDSAGNPADQVTRTVIVQDTTKPVIALNGDDNIVLALNGTYTELGATASDNFDGNISDNITIGGDTVDVKTLGTYIITYNVADSSNNPAEEVIRTVEVKDLPVATFDFLPTPNEANGNYYDNVSLTLTLSSTGNTIYYEMDQIDVEDPTTGSPSISGSGNIDLPAEVDVEIHYVVKFFPVDPTDLAGSIQTLHVFVDTVAPAVTINAVTSPTSETTQIVTGTREPDAAVTVTTDTDSEAGQVDLPGETTWSVEIAELTKDANVITATATDLAGNEKTAQATIDYHPLFAISPSGEVFVPVTVAGFTQGFDISGGSGDFSWSLNLEAKGSLSQSTGTTNVFTPLENEVEDVTLTITDTTYGELAPITVTIHAVEFGVNPASGGLVLGDSLQLEVVGATGEVTWVLSDPNVGSLSDFTPNNRDATFTANSVGTTTITVTDSGTSASVTSQIFEVVNLITVTPAKLAVEDDDTLEFTIAGGTGGGDPANYTLTVIPTAGGGDGDFIGGTFTPKPDNDVRKFKVEAKDNKYANIKAESEEVTIVDPLEIDNVPTPPNLKAGDDPFDFNFSGGTGAVAWTAAYTDGNPLQIGEDGTFVIPETTTVRDVTITATDSLFPALLSDIANINVYPGLIVSVDDADKIILTSAVAQFSIAGGFGSAHTYRWEIKRGKGTINETTGTYTAPAGLDEPSTPEVVTVRATAQNDTSIYDDLEVTISNPISVAFDKKAVETGGTATVTVKGGDRSTYASQVSTSGSTPAGQLGPGTFTPGTGTVYTYTAPDSSGFNAVTFADGNGLADTSDPINIFNILAITSPAESLSGNLLEGRLINLHATGGSQSYKWEYEFSSDGGTSWGSKTPVPGGPFKLAEAGRYRFTVTDLLLDTLTDDVEIDVKAPVVISEEDGIQANGKYKFITAVGDSGDQLLKLSASGGDTASGVTWTSDAVDIATVDVNPTDDTQSTINPVAPGLTRITATDASGYKGFFTVRVVSVLSVAPTPEILRVCAQLTLTPSGGAFRGAGHLDWASSSPTDVTVTKSGVFGIAEAKDPGAATITVTDSTPGLKHSLTATAEISVPKATISGRIIGGGTDVIVSTEADFDPEVKRVEANDDTGVFAVGDLEPGTYYVKAESGNQAGVYPRAITLTAGQFVEDIAITFGEGLQIATDPAGITAIVDGVALNVFAVGGNPPYTWSSDQGTFGDANAPATTFTDNIDVGGTAIITVTDSVSTAVDLEVAVLTAVNAVPADVHVNVGDPVTLDLSGGTGNYNINTSNPAVVSGVVSDSTANMTANGAGTAIVTVADEAHPLFTDTVTVNVYAPAQILVPESATFAPGTQTPLVMAGHSLMFSVAGGSGNIDWSVDGGATVDENGKFTAPDTGHLPISTR